MSGLSFGDLPSVDPQPSGRAEPPALADVFSDYLSGRMAFRDVQAHIERACDGLQRQGQRPETIAGFIRRAVDRGASRATPAENVHRFNAMHDELALWAVNVCLGMRAAPLADVLPEPPVLRDATAGDELEA